MNRTASCVLSVQPGLPFGQVELSARHALAHVWYCRFDNAFYHDEDYGRQGIALPSIIAGSAIKRRAEYLAGRIAADRVLTVLGYPRFDVQIGKDRTPCWPNGIQGALTHHANLALCIGWHRPPREISGLGIDIETVIDAPRTRDLWPGIISAGERAFFSTLPCSFATCLTLAFSAKESLFKALYPLVLRYFDFLDVQVVQLGDNHITLALLVTLTPALPAGTRFDCGYAVDENNVLTVLTLDA
ncbi:4'-phosphopantetheinyl transferase superfamily protein [Acerihabitans sp. TG2]|uniref:4'-phosphopantetheinyl transferase family protein n=1 Tax=Acerihabitans sp. TG2 TaxID=3096008 RepID=UPI002B22FAB7|nr:4'-phosphopantetheinyl transferase superfamily protein [Acerihabitans sp. TG2]MEA9389073.1 4'-phosphopantetheinyl transferase superfamily protein [Acerihabitans sp. TG2]